MLRPGLSSLVFALLALELAITPRPIQGQTMSFLRQFSAPGIEAASSVVADASGIYVFGGKGVRKYDSSGNELWTREVGAPANRTATVSRAAASATGVCVVGLFDSFFPFVRKYDADGKELWTRQFDTVFSIVGVAADATSAYVVGFNQPGVYSFLRKYSADGSELWTQSGPPGSSAFAVSADVTGVYVVEEDFRLRQSFLRKYSAGGKELWTRPWSGFGNLGLGARMSADATGVYVLYVLEGILRKYSADGNELWTQSGYIQSGYASAVAADATGVYVVGSASGVALPGQCRSGSGSDAFVRKYDPDGAELWTRQFGTTDSASATAVAADASGVYVAGQYPVRPFVTFASVPAANAPGAFLAKFEKSPAVVTESRPRILPDCVVNAASYVGGGVAPGEIVTIFGSAMGPSELVPLRLTEDRRLATTLADARILFNGVPAPLLYVSDKQSSAIVPYAVAGLHSVDVQVEYKGVRSDAVTLAVLASRPGIFSLDGSGQGQLAIFNEDGSINSPSNPAQRGSIVTVYATGGGEADPGAVDGQILSDVVPRTSLPVAFLFYDGDAFDYSGEVLYAGGVSGSVAGLLQVKLRVPTKLAEAEGGNFVFFIGSHWERQTMALR